MNDPGQIHVSDDREDFFPGFPKRLLRETRQFAAIHDTKVSWNRFCVMPF